jgi:hypothetical protein
MTLVDATDCTAATSGAQMNLANEIRIVIFRTNSTNQLHEVTKTTAILHFTFGYLFFVFATDHL